METIYTFMLAGVALAVLVLLCSDVVARASRFEWPVSQRLPRFEAPPRWRDPAITALLCEPMWFDECAAAEALEALDAA